MQHHYRFGIDSPDDLPVALRDYAHCKEVMFRVFEDGSIFGEYAGGMLIVEGGGYGG
jgi:hypothetical protein